MYDASRAIVVRQGEEPPGEAQCFADEVTVDFPSVAPAVDRICRGLLADERGPVLPAAVRLSPHEARQGALVPLQVALRTTCPDCGGRGESWTQPCTRCEGHGFELLPHRLRISVPPGVADGSQFRFTVAPRHILPTRIELRVRVA